MINRLAGQPSPLKSVLVSIAVHTAAVSAIYAWPSASTDKFQVEGRRQVIQMTASNFSPAQVTVETQLDPTEVEQEQPFHQASHSPPEARQELVRRKRPTEIGSSSLLKTAPWRLAETPPSGPLSHARRPPNRLAQPSVDAARPPRRPKRVSLTSAPPQHAAILTDQVVGLEKKSPPDLSSNPPPQYPAQAIRLRLEGTVLLRLHINADGNVARVEIIESSGHKLLDRSAIDAVSRWRGQPATRGGHPVATVETLPVRFRL